MSSNRTSRGVVVPPQATLIVHCASGVIRDIIEVSVNGGDRQYMPNTPTSWTQINHMRHIGRTVLWQLDDEEPQSWVGSPPQAARRRLFADEDRKQEAITNRFEKMDLSM